MDQKKILVELTNYKNQYVEKFNKSDKINKKHAIFDMISHIEFGFFIGYQLYLIFFNKLTTTTFGIYVFVILFITFTVTFCPVLNKSKKLKKEYNKLKYEMTAIIKNVKEIKEKYNIKEDGFDQI